MSLPGLRKIRDFINPWDNFDFGKKHTGKERLRGWLIHFFHGVGQKEWHIRYLPVLKELRDHPQQYAAILEVGSGAMGISRYTRKPVVGVDLFMQGPRYPNMRLIKANATALPFPDRSFDLVVSMDMLEHMPRDIRPRAIAEQLRVAKKKVFIGFPCGADSRKWESKAFSRVQERIAHWKGSPQELEGYRRSFSYLDEHAEHGLPEYSEVVDYFKAYSSAFDRNFSWVSIKNEGLLVWYIGVTKTLTGNPFRFILTSLLYWVFFFLVRRLQWPGSYREIFVISRR